MTREFVRSPDEVRDELARLRRFLAAWEKLEEMVPNDSPLGQQAAGAVAALCWLLDESDAALSDCLEDVLRYGLRELGEMRRGGPTGPVGHHSAAGGNLGESREIP